jgi:hypothetical protein
MKNKFNLNNKEFKFTFESKGNTLLFEDLVVEYYMPGRCVVFSEGDRYITFGDLKLIERMNKIGEKQTLKDIVTKKNVLNNMINIFIKENNFSSYEKSITLKEVKYFFQKIGEIMYHYSYFDHFYWEGVYEKKNKNEKMNDLIINLGNFKNVVRESMNPIFFDNNGALISLLRKISSILD